MTQDNSLRQKMKAKKKHELMKNIRRDEQSTHLSLHVLFLIGFSVDVSGNTV